MLAHARVLAALRAVQLACQAVDVRDNVHTPLLSRPTRLQGLTITPTVIQWNSDFSFFPNNIEEEDEEQPTGGTVTVVAEAQESSDPDENFFDPPVVGGDDGGDDGGDAEGGDDGGGDDGARK